jgi:hypothetical protein
VIYIFALLPDSRRQNPLCCEITRAIASSLRQNAIAWLQLLRVFGGRPAGLPQSFFIGDWDQHHAPARTGGGDMSIVVPLAARRSPMAIRRVLRTPTSPPTPD